MTTYIVGISGQEAAYLARHLLWLGYQVVGTSIDSQLCNTSNLEGLGISFDIELVSLALNDFRSVLRVLTLTRPGEIYNLAGQASVGLSFEQTDE